MNLIRFPNAKIIAGYFRSVILPQAILLLMVFLIPAEAQVSESLRAIIEDGHVSDSYWSVVVTDSSGNLIENYNGEKLIRPASTQKLITSAAALHLLGPDYIYETVLYGSGSQEQNVWKGDLLIRGKGDPTINGDFYNDPMFLFEEWVELFDSLGVNRIDGNLIGNDSYFDDVPYPRGWEWDDLSYYYGVEINALSFNKNVVDLEVIADGPIGSVPDITWFPFDTPFVEFINEQIITPPNTSFDESYRRILGTNTIILRSSLPQGYYETEPLSVTHPTLYFLDTMKRYFENRGIQVNGQILKDRESRNWETAGYQMLHLHKSVPLKEIVREKNENSDNFYSEILVKTLASEVYKVEGSTELGLKAVKQFLHSAGIDTNNVRMSDGSGMAPANLIRATDLNQLLLYMKESEHYGYFRNSLARAGNSGTLRYRFHNSPVRGRFAGKSGFVSGVRALSGYLTSRDGQELIVTITTNNYTKRTALIDQVHQRILEHLYSVY